MIMRDNCNDTAHGLPLTERMSLPSSGTTPATSGLIATA
jgi:hypothetical protein